MRTPTLCPWANLSISLYFYSGFLIAVSSWPLHLPVFVLPATLRLEVVSRFQRIYDGDCLSTTCCWDDGHFSQTKSYHPRYCLRSLSHCRYHYCYSMHCDQNQNQIYSTLSPCPLFKTAFIAFLPCFTPRELSTGLHVLLQPSVLFPSRPASP